MTIVLAGWARGRDRGTNATWRMAAAKHIICVGHAALDRIYRIAAFPPHPTKVRALEHIEVGGGMAANAAVAVARLGGRAELWSRVGDDAAAQTIRAGLRAEHVDVRYVQAFEGARSSTSAIIVDDNGERLIVGQRDAGMPSGTSWLPLEPSNRWTYTSNGQRTIRLPQAPEQVTPTSGKHITEVTRQIGGTAGGDGAFEMVHGSEKRDASGAVESEAEKWFVSKMGSRLMLVGGDRDAAPIEIRRPVTLFPGEPRPGFKYDGGRLVSKGIDLDVQGEVVGYEDVKTPAGSFRRCLVLRVTAKVAGAAEPGSGDARGDPDRLVEIARLDQEVAPQLLLRLHPGAVGGRYPAVAHPDRRGGIRR